MPSFVSAGPAGGWLRHAFRRHGNGSLGLPRGESAACCRTRRPGILISYVLRDVGSAPGLAHAAVMPRPQLPSQFHGFSLSANFAERAWALLCIRGCMWLGTNEQICFGCRALYSFHRSVGRSLRRIEKFSNCGEMADFISLESHIRSCVPFCSLKSVVTMEMCVEGQQMSTLFKKPLVHLDQLYKGNLFLPRREIFHDDPRCSRRTNIRGKTNLILENGLTVFLAGSYFELLRCQQLQRLHSQNC